MYTCILCPDKTEWTRSLCSKCMEIKKIIDLYSVEKVVESMKYIYVRDNTPIKFRQEAILKKPSKEVEKKKEKLSKN